MSDPTYKPKRLVLCLDGTWNNPYQMKKRVDGSRVLKPSNPLKMCRSIRPHDADTGTDQLTYYDVGVGALGKYPGLSNRLLGLCDSYLGGGWGAGFESNVEAALTFLVNNYVGGDEIYVFGFSRGAAQARSLTRFVDWAGGIPIKRDAYYLPILFRHYITSGGSGDPKEASAATPTIRPIAIEFLGVWDTVMALGSRFRAHSGTAVAERSFHVDQRPAQCVANARQALAIDEQRFDFRPEIWTGTAHDQQTLEQRWFAGVHSNIGGGYVEDGLANIPFRWLVNESTKLSLRTDPEFVNHYNPYPQARLHQSKTMLYRVMESVRLHFNGGKRRLLDQPDEAKLNLDKSVIHRMNSQPDPKRHDQLSLYRPNNVIEFLAAQDNLQAYLLGLGLTDEEATLPDDVAKRIQDIRQDA